MSGGTRADDAASGSSLWLLPEGAVYEELSARIDALASQHGSPRFPPHVTLLGGLTGDAAELLAAAARTASATDPFTVRLVAAVARNEYFRRLVLEVQPTEALDAARARAAAALTLPATGFEPHLSLLYGRAEVASTDAGVRLPLAFTCRQLALWRTQGAVSEWQALGHFRLGSAETA
jgi:2'-5' RNA ligase